jgi:glycosyltransferase involved in cell wall biosynthesis
VYERVDLAQLREIPREVKVIRAFALDSRQHLSIRGKYPWWLALPDRWATWFLGAVLSGLHAIRHDDIDVIYSTSPIPTAVAIGWFLHRLTHKPWIVDFRDPMVEDNYPRDARVRTVNRWFESKAARCASMLLFTTPGTRKMYLERYSSRVPESCRVVHNGYDEEDFKDLVFDNRLSDDRPLRLLHAGLIYPEARDPQPLFRALGRLKSKGIIDIQKLRIDLRASGIEAYLQSLLDQEGIADIVNLLPPLPYREALQDAANSDALLLLQGASCNHQIPAKAYEYMRLRRPILALTPLESDTASVLREAGGATIINLADEATIYETLPKFLAVVREGKHPVSEPASFEKHQRRNQALQLAPILHELLEQPTHQKVQF